MAKIQPFPNAASPSPCSSSSSVDQKSPQAYTVWMKSLVFNGNSCTVYGPDGVIAFRVDKYAFRGGRKVFFMDHAGNALIRIGCKGFGMFKRWEVSQCGHNALQDEVEESMPWFSVRQAEKGTVAVEMHGGARTCYRIDGFCACKLEYKVSGVDDAVVAEVARKQAAVGVVLGEDVLTLTMGPKMDHLLAKVVDGY